MFLSESRSRVIIGVIIGQSMAGKVWRAISEQVNRSCPVFILK